MASVASANTYGQRGPLPASITTMSDYYNSGRGSRLGGGGPRTITRG